jgi:hypothetical protein
MIVIKLNWRFAIQLQPIHLQGPFETQLYVFKTINRGAKSGKHTCHLVYGPFETFNALIIRVLIFLTYFIQLKKNFKKHKNNLIIAKPTQVLW